MAVPDSRNCNVWHLMTIDRIPVGFINCIVAERLAMGMVKAWNATLPPDTQREV